ncbi:MAG: orotidine-5'-phosphate decarboxylase [bacterium]|jgi:orotidine-5'-phosphate decarboxylase|nr:orotidine-5'-phosphate decarboxylase [bacterium]
MRTLIDHINKRGNRLCLGLDLDPERMPTRYLSLPNPLAALGCDLVEATHDLVAAFKPNAAFFEQQGAPGWAALEAVCHCVGERAFLIVDAKRGDIGNTSARYARALFNGLGARAVTLAPYMGRDSLEPFLGATGADDPRPERGAFVLALTSNPGAADFQLLPVEGRPLYWRVLEKLAAWNADWAAGRLGAVVGATRTADLAEIRAAFPGLPLLIPGVGAQGGSLEEVQAILEMGGGPALINVSRDILYGPDAVAEPEAVRRRALDYARRLGCA